MFRGVGHAFMIPKVFDFLHVLGDFHGDVVIVFMFPRHRYTSSVLQLMNHDSFIAAN